MAKTPAKANTALEKAKPIIVYLILAGNIVRDINTLKYSFIDIFDVVRIPTSLGFVYQSFFVGARLNNVRSGHSKTEVLIIAPDKSVFVTASLEGELNKGDLGFSAVFELLKFEKPGRYYLRVTHNGVKLDDNNKYFFDVIPE